MAATFVIDSYCKHCTVHKTAMHCKVSYVWDSKRTGRDYSGRLGSSGNGDYINKFVLNHDEKLLDSVAFSDYEWNLHMSKPDTYKSHIEKPDVYTKKSLCAYKGLDAYYYVPYGHVQAIRFSTSITI